MWSRNRNGNSVFISERCSLSCHIFVISLRQSKVCQCGLTVLVLVVFISCVSNK